MAFDVEDRMNFVNQPLLMIAGREADTLYMTKDAFAKAFNAKSKDLHLIPGVSHIKTYWKEEYVNDEKKALTAFFGKNL